MGQSGYATVIPTEPSKPERPLLQRPLAFAYQPLFKGVIFENSVIKKVVGKKFQGLGIYVKDTLGGSYIDMKKMAYSNLAQEPIDIIKASKEEIAAHRFSLAITETYAKNPDDASEFSTQWVSRYNPDNRTSPLSISHALNDFDTMEDIFANNIEILSDPTRCKSLDIPITDKDGNLILDAIVFDTETTGTNILKDKIVQIGAMLLKNGKIVKGEKGTYNMLINPEMPIPEVASAVNGITDDMVKKAPTFEKAAKKFLTDYMCKSNGIIVGWNAVKFDVPLLNRMIRELRDVNNITEKDPLNKIIAEKQLFKVVDPQIILQRLHPFVGASKKLSNQYHWFFCKQMPDAHDALADVKGTIPMLQYCAYRLSELRVNKSVPLTLRQLLLFQNGAQNIPEIKPILHASKNFNSKVKFDVSYRPENLDLINYFDGYHLDEKMIRTLANEIGEENIQRMKDKEIIGTKIDEKYKGFKLQAAETNKIPHTNKKISLAYNMKQNLKTVLDVAKLEGFNGKSKEEIEELICENAKVYYGGETRTLWIKNVNQDDVSIGNDLPDDKITARVMKELEEN